MYEHLQTVNFLKVPRTSKSHCGLFCKSDSLTDQSFLQESQIMTILKRYKTTGLAPQITTPSIPLDKQTPDLSDLQELHNYLCELRNRPDLMVALRKEENGSLDPSVIDSADGTATDGGDGGATPPAKTAEGNPSTI